MGIKDLWNFLRKQCPEVFHEVSFSSLTGKYALDVSTFLFKYIKTSGDDWLDRFFGLVITLKKQGADIVYVFDGERPEEKQKESEKRRKAQSDLQNRKLRCDEVYDLAYREYIERGAFSREIEEQVQAMLTVRGKFEEDVQDVEWMLTLLGRKKKSLEKQANPVTEKHVSLAQELLRLLGVSSMIAEGEAEATCAFMNISGEVDGVLSEDGDLLALGTPCLYRHVQPSRGTCEEVRIQEILDRLDMTQSQFRDMCILLGCDYNQRPKGFGQVKSFRMMKKYGSIEKMLKREECDTEALRLQECRRRFDTPHNLKRYKPPLDEYPDEEGIKLFLMEHTINISLDRVREVFFPKARIVFGED